MRAVCLLALLFVWVPAVLAHDGAGRCTPNPDLEYARWRARLDDCARNAEIESQRQLVNVSYLRLYQYRRLPAIPARMIEPTRPVPRPR